MRDHLGGHHHRAGGHLRHRRAARPPGPPPHHAPGRRHPDRAHLARPSSCGPGPTPTATTCCSCVGRRTRPLVAGVLAGRWSTWPSSSARAWCVGLGAYPAPVPHTRPDPGGARPPPRPELARQVGLITRPRRRAGRRPGRHRGAGHRARACRPSGCGPRSPTTPRPCPTRRPALALIESLAEVAGVQLRHRHPGRRGRRRPARASTASSPTASEHQQLVRQLEEQVDAQAEADGRPLPSGEELAAELERYPPRPGRPTDPTGRRARTAGCSDQATAADRRRRRAGRRVGRAPARRRGRSCRWSRRPWGRTRPVARSATGPAGSACRRRRTRTAPCPAWLSSSGPVAFGFHQISVASSMPW